MNDYAAQPQVTLVASPATSFIWTKRSPDILIGSQRRTYFWSSGLVFHQALDESVETVIRRIPLSLAVATIVALGTLEPGAQVKGSPAPIRQIDHIMIRADDPGKLYAFFTEILQLPVAWPMVSPRPGVTTGGVGFGNVNVEAINFPGQKRRPSPAELLGFALEPASLRDSLAELDRRGISYGELRPLISTGQDGTRKTLWTNVTLRQFSDSEGPADASIHIFLSEYSPTYVDVEERRARLRKQLVESAGGPLGVEAVKEVVIGVTDLERARGLWQKLLDPTPSSGSNVWQLGSGPAIRLMRANQNTVRELVISVGSLPRAKAFLREKRLLGSESEDEATIDPSKIYGLTIRVVAKK
jgi:catechol 2,3-dioxygenase-like lactoylglutathione lyase family enzyme